MFQRTISKITERVSKAVNENPSSDMTLPTEASVYKELLTDMQYQQLLVSREYQLLFKEKEEEIKRLRGLLGESPSSEVSSSVSEESSPSKTKDKGSLKELSPDEIRVVLREWERKMKNNIVQKTEALAEAQIHRETCEVLRAQIDSTREQLSGTEKLLKRQANVDQNRAEQQAAVEKLTLEFASMMEESKKTNEMMEELRLENNALRTKAESDSQTLAVMAGGGATAAAAAVAAATASADEQLAEDLRRVLAEKHEVDLKLASLQAQFEKELSDASALLVEERSKTRAAQEQIDALMQDLETALQIHADELKRQKQAAHADATHLEQERDAVVKQLAEVHTLLTSNKTDLQVALEREAGMEKRLRERDEALQSLGLNSDTQLQREVSKAVSEREAFDGELACAKANISTLETQFSEATASAAALSVQVALLNESLESERAIAEQASSKFASLEATLQAHALSAVEWQTRISSLESTALIATREINSLHESLNSERLATKSVTSAHAALEETLQASSTESSARIASSEALLVTAVSRVALLESDALASSSHLASLESSLKTEEEKANEASAVLEETIAKLALAVSSATSLTDTKSQLESAVAALTLETDSLSTQAKELASQIASVTARLEESELQRAELQLQVDDLTLNLNAALLEKSDLQKQMDEFDTKLEQERSKVKEELDFAHERELKELAVTHEQQLHKSKKETAEYREMYAKETKARRAAHDELMDARGNIRVYSRVRPKLPIDAKNGDDAIATEFPLESGGRDVVVVHDLTKSRFEFDLSFDPNSTQEQVFDQVAPLIVSVMDGVNVTLFAYGQTGSGKTFTMEGTKENPGVNIRALQRIFNIAQERATTFKYAFTVSVLEVYNETILDLLGTNIEDRDAREKLDIRQQPDSKMVFVQGLEKHLVVSMTDVESFLTLASKNRTVAGHNMNEHSSRSHLVFTLTCSCTSLLKNERLEGNLNLIDLAGSERVGKTEATGDRLKEAQFINKSLSALGDVISALGERGKTGGHIPFRNSKLTFLLQDQLQGNAKVGFFANAAPTQYNSSETLCTLKFAERCRKTELGRAKKNVVASTSEDSSKLSGEIARLRRQNDELQTKLAATLSGAGAVTAAAADAGDITSPAGKSTPGKTA